MGLSKLTPLLVREVGFHLVVVPLITCARSQMRRQMPAAAPPPAAKAAGQVMLGTGSAMQAVELLHVSLTRVTAMVVRMEKAATARLRPSRAQCVASTRLPIGQSHSSPVSGALKSYQSLAGTMETLLPTCTYYRAHARFQL